LAGPEEPPTPLVRAVGPPPEPSTIILVTKGTVARHDIPMLCERVRVLLEGSDADQVVFDVAALVDPDAVTVDALARLQLTARRLGRQIRLRHACGELQDLLSLLGLSEVMPLCEGSAFEPSGQAEQREQARGVQEERDPRDPTR
jgi:ABC-type transporter Mla MlaB component